MSALPNSHFWVLSEGIVLWYSAKDHIWVLYQGVMFGYCARGPGGRVWVLYQEVLYGYSVKESCFGILPRDHIWVLYQWVMFGYSAKGPGGLVWVLYLVVLYRYSAKGRVLVFYQGTICGCSTKGSFLDTLPGDQGVMFWYSRLHSSIHFVLQLIPNQDFSIITSIVFLLNRLQLQIIKAFYPHF